MILRKNAESKEISLFIQALQASTLPELLEMKESLNDSLELVQHYLDKHHDNLPTIK